MSNYKELIKRLRVAVDVHEAKGCVLEISAETCAEIADAIEQLIKERDELKLDLCEANDTIEYLNDKLKDFGEERDSLKKKVEERCHICKHYNPSDWEWRGVQE